MLLGGFGFLGRLHGLSIDNLVEVEMVLADGRIVIVNENDYPGTDTPLSILSFLLRLLNLYLRSLVGAPWRWPRARCCDTIQGTSLPCPSGLRGQSHLVSLHSFILT